MPLGGAGGLGLGEMFLRCSWYRFVGDDGRSRMYGRLRGRFFDFCLVCGDRFGGRLGGWQKFLC